VETTVGRMAVTNQEVEDRVLKLVEDQWKGADPLLIQINNRFPEFVQASLYVVSIYDKDEKKRRSIRIMSMLSEIISGSSGM
jgi:hypothetical protein